jgi:hypothetical protein
MKQILPKDSQSFEIYKVFLCGPTTPSTLYKFQKYSQYFWDFPNFMFSGYLHLLSAFLVYKSSCCPAYAIFTPTKSPLI